MRFSEKVLEDISSDKITGWFDLSENYMGDDGAIKLAVALEKNPSVRVLNLSSNIIGDNGAKHIVVALEKNTNIHMLHLKLNNNRISDEGVERIAEMLEKNINIHTLDLSNNNISDRGGRRLIEALKINTTLHKLLFNEHSGLQEIINELLKKDRTMIAELYVRNVDFSDVHQPILTSVSLMPKQLLEDIKSKNRTTTTELDYSDMHPAILTSASLMPRQPTEELLEGIKSNETIGELNLSSCDIDDDAAKRLAAALEENTSIHTLNLSSNDIDNEGAKYLATALEKNKTLRIIDLRSNWIEDDGAEYLVKMLEKNKTIQKLYLDNVSDPILQKINQLLTRNSTPTQNQPSKSSLLPSPPLPSKPVSHSPVSVHAPLLTLKQKEALDILIAQQEYGALFKGYLHRIRQHPDLEAFFQGMQQFLDNLVLSLKTVNGGYVQSTNGTQTALGIIQNVLGGVAGVVGGPAGAGIHAGSAVVCGLLKTWETHKINNLAVHVSRLFPNSSDNGHVLTALAVLLTINQENKILNLAANDNRTRITRTFDEWKALFGGRDNFTIVDKEVVIQGEQILNFWKDWDESQSAKITAWLPKLLQLFGIQPPPALNLEHLIIPASIPADALHVQQTLHLTQQVAVPPSPAEMPELTRQVQAMQQNMERLNAVLDASPSNDLSAMHTQLAALKQQLRQLETTAGTNEFIRSQLSVVNRRLEEIERAHQPVPTGNGRQLFAHAPAFANAGQVQTENRELRQIVESLLSSMQTMEATIEDINHQLEFHSERITGRASTQTTRAMQEQRDADIQTLRRELRQELLQELRQELLQGQPGNPIPPGNNGTQNGICVIL